MSTIPYHMVNEVINCSANVNVPVAGMLGTYFVGSDSYAYVVVNVYTPKKILVVPVDDKELANKFVKDGVEYLSEEFTFELFEKHLPKYPYFENHYGEDGEEIFKYDLKKFYKDNTFTFRKNGRWIHEGEDLWACEGIHLGKGENYRDPNF